MCKMKKLPKGLRIFFKTLICLVLVIVLAAIGYFAYLMISYKRIDDNQTLEAKGTAAYGSVQIGGTYRIATQNLGFGAYEQDYTFFMDGGKESWARSEDAVKRNIKAGATEVKTFSPDFVLFQEVDFDSTRSYHVDESAILTAEFEEYMYTTAVNYHSAFLLYPFNKPHGSSNSELMTLSRYTVTGGIRRSFPISKGLSKFLDLDRCYSKTYVPVEGTDKSLILYNVHSSAYGGSDEIRNAQMTMLFNDMKEEYNKGNYCVCGGDFNHDFTTDSKVKLNGKDDDKYGWAQPFPVDLLPEEIIQCTDYSTSNGDKPWPTCRNCDIPYKEGNFTIIVDGFLITKNVRCTYLENDYTAFTYSDHCPVFMEFELLAE